MALLARLLRRGQVDSMPPMANDIDSVITLPMQCPACDQPLHQSARRLMEERSALCEVCGHFLQLEGRDWQATIGAISEKLN